jgi:hypothetical protein
MRMSRISVAVVALFVVQAAAAPPYGQKASAVSLNADRARHSLAINLLRAINTAEADHRMKHGSYVTWDILVTSEEFTSCGMQWAAENESQLATVHFSKGAEILPGWTLRLDVTHEGAGYDLLLEDTTDKACGYAAITDERGIIRQSKAIDCHI